MNAANLIASIGFLENWTPPKHVRTRMIIDGNRGKRRLFICLSTHDDDETAIEVTAPPGPAELASLDRAANQLLEAAWNQTVTIPAGKTSTGHTLSLVMDRTEQRAKRGA